MKQERNRVLIVDDQQVNRMILKRVLEENYQIMEAEDGPEAIQLLENYVDQTVVVLLDIIMPDMDGFEVLRIMRDRGWLEQIPVILVTADTTRESALRGYQLGVMDVITKPFYQEVIKHRVDNIAELYQYRRREVQSQTMARLEGTFHKAKIGKREQKKGLPVNAAEIRTEPVLGVVSDAHEVDAQLLLELEQEKYRIIAELSDDMVFSYNALLDSVECNEKLCHVFRVPAYLDHFSRYQKEREKLLKEEYAQIQEKWGKLTPKQPLLRMDLHIPLPNGTRPWFQMVIRLLVDRKGTGRILGYVGKLTNINRIKLEASEWQKRANTDALTQLYNRAGAQVLFQELVREQPKRPITVAFLDLDHFKRLNDTMGHEAGDQILIAYAQKIKSVFRPIDVVARFGGDEFLVMIGDMGNADDAWAKLEPLCQLMIPIPMLPHPQHVSSSIGVAFYPADGTDLDELVRKADLGLYESKRRGRGRVSFYQNLPNENESIEVNEEPLG